MIILIPYNIKLSTCTAILITIDSRSNMEGITTPSFFMKILLLPLLLGFSVPAIAHNEANTARLSKGNCSNLVAHNTASGCTGSCKWGDTCRDAFNQKYVCCATGDTFTPGKNCNFIVSYDCVTKCSDPG